MTSVVSLFLSLISPFLHNICEFFANPTIHFSPRDSSPVIVAPFLKDGSANSSRSLKLLFIVLIADSNLLCGFTMYFGQNIDDLLTGRSEIVNVGSSAGKLCELVYVSNELSDSMAKVGK